MIINRHSNDIVFLSLSLHILYIYVMLIYWHQHSNFCCHCLVARLRLSTSQWFHNIVYMYIYIYIYEDYGYFPFRLLHPSPTQSFFPVCHFRRPAEVVIGSTFWISQEKNPLSVLACPRSPRTVGGRSWVEIRCFVMIFGFLGCWEDDVVFFDE